MTTIRGRRSGAIFQLALGETLTLGAALTLGLALTIGASLVASPALAQSPTPDKPNVIFIMTDDVGYGDLGSYGATDIATPNLDQLAREGVRFTDFYANAPVCTPTRAGFMTGRYQQRYGLERPLGSETSVAGAGLFATGETLPALLGNNGYRTALIGKWHLGYADDQSPTAHGFDYFFGYKSGYLDYYQHTDGDGELDLWLNDETLVEEGYLTDLITEQAVAFIEDNTDRPFFLSVQYSAAHWPYQPPDMPSVAADNATHLQPYDDSPGTREDYAAMLERADEGVGEIVAAIDRAGLAGNTLIIFTNDNGGEWLSRNAPLFNRKSTVWEGGIRVPAMLRWPGVIPADVVTHQVGITMDLTATILAISGTEVPEDLALEGINLLPIVSGAAPEVARTLFWRMPNARAVRRGEWKYVVMGSGLTEQNFVFNLNLDPGERNDMAFSAQGQAVARELRPALDAWEAEVTADGEKFPWMTAD